MDSVKRLLETARLRNCWLATAESCTGGAVAHGITKLAGCSDVFAGGVVAYSNALKIHLLDVPEALLKQFGAVSEPVAVAMAEGCARRVARVMQDGRDVLAVSVTGIAGPQGGSASKPVGCVHIAASMADSCSNVKRSLHRLHVFKGARQEIQHAATDAALQLMQDYLIQQAE